MLSLTVQFLLSCLLSLLHKNHYGCFSYFERLTLFVILSQAELDRYCGKHLSCVPLTCHFVLFIAVAVLDVPRNILNARVVPSINTDWAHSLVEGIYHLKRKHTVGRENGLLAPSFRGGPHVLNDYVISLVSVMEFFTGAGAECKHLAHQEWNHVSISYSCWPPKLIWW